MMNLNVGLANQDSKAVLKFRLNNSPIAWRWMERVRRAQSMNYNIDDPKRFYGFNCLEDEIAHALKLINQSVDCINNFSPIIERRLTNVTDQDTLNYLHHIFETYHGLLDQQNNNFWQSAPVKVRQALADLNIHVHRCESVARGSQPRFVVTYYGLPKTCYLNTADFELFTTEYRFGTVYLNYVEIGKTLEDLSRDNDSYIADDAFRPYKQFSADFNIKFFDVSADESKKNIEKTYSYYDQHQQWFESRGYVRNDIRLRPGQIPLAHLNTELSNDEVLDLVKNHQHVSSIWFDNF
jgi:hypothetical protein